MSFQKIMKLMYTITKSPLTVLLQSLHFVFLTVVKYNRKGWRSMWGLTCKVKVPLSTLSFSIAVLEIPTREVIIISVKSHHHKGKQ